MTVLLRSEFDFRYRRRGVQRLSEHYEAYRVFLRELIPGGDALSAVDLIGEDADPEELNRARTRLTYLSTRAKWKIRTTAQDGELWVIRDR